MPNVGKIVSRQRIFKARRPIDHLKTSRNIQVDIRRDRPTSQKGECIHSAARVDHRNRDVGRKVEGIIAAISIEGCDILIIRRARAHRRDVSRRLRQNIPNSGDSRSVQIIRSHPAINATADLKRSNKEEGVAICSARETLNIDKEGISRAGIDDPRIISRDAPCGHKIGTRYRIGSPHFH